MLPTFIDIINEELEKIKLENKKNENKEIEPETTGNWGDICIEIPIAEPVKSPVKRKINKFNCTNYFPLTLYKKYVFPDNDIIPYRGFKIRNKDLKTEHTVLPKLFDFIIKYKAIIEKTHKDFILSTILSNKFKEEYQLYEFVDRSENGKLTKINKMISQIKKMKSTKLIFDDDYHLNEDCDFDEDKYLRIFVKNTSFKIKSNQGLSDIFKKNNINFKYNQKEKYYEVITGLKYLYNIPNSEYYN